MNKKTKEAKTALTCRPTLRWLSYEGNTAMVGYPIYGYEFKSELNVDIERHSEIKNQIHLLNSKSIFTANPLRV